jgi:hypothetical protein
MGMVEIENVTHPGKTYRVDAQKFQVVREAYLAVLPDDGPGLTPAEILALLKPRLPQDLFPGGEKAGWWAKSVQLDLEAKGLILRAEKPPVRLRRVR